MTRILITLAIGSLVTAYAVPEEDRSLNPASVVSGSQNGNAGTASTSSGSTDGTDDGGTDGSGTNDDPNDPNDDGSGTNDNPDDPNDGTDPGVDCSIDVDQDGLFSVDDPCGTGTDTDDDNDGYTAESAGGDDCNDGYEYAYPGATNWCNDGEDLNCNNINDADEDECTQPPACSIDIDGDGLFSVNDPCGTGTDCDDDGDGVNVDTIACGGDGIVADGDDETHDCNDGYEYAYPGATNWCVPGDDLNCNGDDDATEAECSTDDLDGDGMTVAEGDCDDDDAETYAGATELCDNDVDNNCDGTTDDKISECWVTLYRWDSPSSETRCFGDEDLHSGPPSYCDTYTYEREAFIFARQQFDGNVPVYDCYAGADDEYHYDQIFTLDEDAKDDLEDDGYTCVSEYFTWEIGDSPGSYSPFADTCDVRRFVWDPGAMVGNGHIFTIGNDSETNLIDEGDVFRAEVNDASHCDY